MPLVETHVEIGVRGDWRVRLIKVAINIRVAGEGVRLGAVGEVVDVFRADDVDEFERGLAARWGLCLTLIRGLALGGRSNGC